MKFFGFEGERPFKCDEKNCGKTFTRNEELTRHKRIHSGLRPFPCTQCGKRFGRKDHLKKHTRTHLQPRGLYAVPVMLPIDAWASTPPGYSYVPMLYWTAITHLPKSHRIISTEIKLKTTAKHGAIKRMLMKRACGKLIKRRWGKPAQISMRAQVNKYKIQSSIQVWIVHFSTTSTPVSELIEICLDD